MVYDLYLNNDSLFKKVTHSLRFFLIAAITENEPQWEQELMPRNQVGNDCQMKEDGAFYQNDKSRGGKIHHSWIYYRVHRFADEMNAGYDRGESSLTLRKHPKSKRLQKESWRWD